MNKIFITITILLIIDSIICWGASKKKPFEENSYIKQSAKEKQDAIWSKIIEDKSSNDWFSTLGTMGIFMEKMITSFDHDKDSMPDGRSKYIHTVGTVGKFELVSTSNKYSGIFKGCKSVIGRLSCAKKPDESKTSAKGALNNFTPGMALKCLRDGIHSANIIVMFSVEGQESWNFFKNDFTNHIPQKINDFALRLLAKKFATATKFVSTLGTKDFAQFDENGNEEKEIKLPFSLVFKPSDKLRNGYPDTFKENFLETLKKIEPNQVLYDIYANEGPDADYEKIGELKLVSNMFTSKFGDKELFYQHTLWDDDINLRPEWEGSRSSFINILKNYNPHAKVEPVEDA